MLHLIKNSLRIAAIALLAFPVIAARRDGAQASPISVGKEIQAQVHLKVNNYYVLFTAPDVSYIDANNRLMLPLRAVGELLGADVNYDAKLHRAMVSLAKHQVELTLNANIASYDGTIVKLDTMPVMKQGQFFIPAKVLLNGLHIKADYEESLLSISIPNGSERRSVTQRLDESREFQTVGHFRPLYFKMNLPPAGSKDKRILLTFVAKNVSGNDLPAGAEDFHTADVTIGGYSFSDPIPERSREAVPAGDTYEVNRTLYSSEGSLKYILVSE
ncbi:copper amine oxidase N-terminal domain-containing protein [Cohnella sp. GCM10012308]|uniref:copper amine oxidase N-terminal domain-containing protein n=1 Tax=Cohnella sp. GCM10012308 TaxID=3317329 RepID=UPI00361BCB7D